MSLFLCASICLGLLSVSKVIAASAFLFRLHLPMHGLKGRITLILPLSGRCPSLHKLIKAIGIQTLQPHKLIIAVESKNDPGYDHAQKIATQATFPIEIIIAGLTNRCAQKCWNQIAAFDRLDGLDDVIIFLDADIEPQPSWLSLLATPILAGKADLVTGYRWHRISCNRLTQHLVAFIDRGIAILPSPARAQLTWGGSLALSNKTLAKLNLPVLLSSTLSDDCAIGLHAYKLGLRVLTRRLLRVPSSSYNNFTSAWNFGRRQYQIIHLYRTGLWYLALTTLTIRLCSWMMLFIGIYKFPEFMAVLLLLSLFSLSTTILQQKIAQRLGVSDSRPARYRQLIVSLLEPLITLIHWSMIAAASYTKIVRWGHVSYKINKNDDIEVLTRTPWKKGNCNEEKETL